MPHSPIHKQAGFSSGIIVAIVLVIAVIGGVGFFVSNQHTKTKGADAASTTPPPATPKETNPNPTPAAQTGTGAELTVKEWGVTIPLPEAVKDAYYVVSTSSADSDGSPNTLLVGQTSLDALGCKASDGNQGKKPLGMILRVSPTETDPVQGKTYTELYPGGVTIDGHYYTYKSWAASNTCAPKEKLQTLDSAMSQAIKSTVATAKESTSN